MGQNLFAVMYVIIWKPMNNYQEIKNEKKEIATSCVLGRHYNAAIFAGVKSILSIAFQVSLKKV